MRRLRSLPIQLRITLGSLLVAGIVLAAVAGLMAHQIRTVTAASEETLALGDIAPYVSALRKHPDETPDAPAAGILVAVRAESGAFLINSLSARLQENLDDRDLHSRSFDRVMPSQRNASAPTRRVSSGGTTYVVVERHLVTSGGDFTVWGARSTTSGDLTIRALDRSLILGMVLALLAFAAAAWVLSSLSLRPVRRLVRSAEQLSHSDDGERRLPVSAAGDELSTLATTLNAFIARLRASADHERQMVSDASHELRTPLAALTARLELAHRSFGDARALEHELLAAEASVARLSALTTTLLELSRLDEPRAAPDLAAAASARALVRELLASVDRARIGPGRGAVTIEFDAERVVAPDARYAISPEAFGRIVDNLVGNAVAFSPETGVVTAALEQASGGAIMLTVVDEGPGVPPEFLPIAFDRFTRADESRRRIRGGTGLGLALVRGLALSAGGRADLSNRVGRGAEARVELPEM